jgi:hypothetical protein
MYFRRQAEVLLGLARATVDLGVARRPRSLATEFQDKADEFDGDEADFSQMPSGGGGHRATSTVANFGWPWWNQFHCGVCVLEVTVQGVLPVQRGSGIQPGPRCAPTGRRRAGRRAASVLQPAAGCMVRGPNNYQIAQSLAADAALPRPAGMIMSALKAAEARRSGKP